MARDQDALATAALLLGGGAAGYALGRFVIDRSSAANAQIRAQPVVSLAPSAAPLRPVATAPARATPQRPTTAMTATRPASMPVDPYSPTPTTSTARWPLSGQPSSAQPIDPYAEPSPNAPSRVHVGPPAGAVPMDPYTTPARVVTPAATISAHSGPITSPSQLATTPAATESAALGAELADVLTSTRPSTSPPRRPVLPSFPATGPITSPAQVSTSPTHAGAVSPSFDLQIGPVQVVSPSAPASTASSLLPRHFDSAFERYRGSIPIEYVRALVARESSFRPSTRTGSAIGLLQIIPVVLDDYNKRHGTTYLREHLVDPSINVAIGCELLRLIIGQYRRYHPRVANLQANWDNPRFVELLTFGWNAGFSEAGGVGRVARYIEQLGVTELTIDRVHGSARDAGASKHLSNPAKVRWSKSVVALYLRERAASRATHLAARSFANPH